MSKPIKRVSGKEINVSVTHSKNVRLDTVLGTFDPETDSMNEHNHIIILTPANVKRLRKALKRAVAL